MVSTALYKSTCVWGTVASYTLFKANSSWEHWEILPCINLPLSRKKWSVLAPYKATSVVGTVGNTTMYKTAFVWGTVVNTALYKTASAWGKEGSTTL